MGSKHVKQVKMWKCHIEITLETKQIRLSKQKPVFLMSVQNKQNYF